MLVTDKNAFDVAELVALDPRSTVDEYAAAAAVLAQSPDWMQRSLGREIRAGLYALPGAELQTTHSASVQRYITLYPEMQQADWPARPPFTSDFSKLWRDIVWLACYCAAIIAFLRWMWPQ